MSLRDVMDRVSRQTLATFRWDRVIMGNAHGEKSEVFDPPWWNLPRWIRWWLAPSGRKSVGEVTVFAGERALTKRVRWMRIN